MLTLYTLISIILQKYTLNISTALPVILQRCVVPHTACQSSPLACYQLPRRKLWLEVNYITKANAGMWVPEMITLTIQTLLLISHKHWYMPIYAYCVLYLQAKAVGLSHLFSNFVHFWIKTCMTTFPRNHTSWNQRWHRHTGHRIHEQIARGAVLACQTKDMFGSFIQQAY